MQRKDYALAEETMRNFAQKYPSDPLIADSQYWLGESFFQRQQYRDAAEAFLGVTTKFDKSGKAPDALLRLGQSLAALKEKEAACAALVQPRQRHAFAFLAVPLSRLGRIRKDAVGIKLARQNFTGVEQNLMVLGPIAHRIIARLVHPIFEIEHARFERLLERFGTLRVVAVAMHHAQQANEIEHWSW